MSKLPFFIPELVDKMLEELEDCRDANEIPSVCIVFEEYSGSISGSGYEILASSRNRIMGDSLPTSHAEILSIQKACQIKNNERLDGLSLITTLEPCCMCSGAIIHSRIKKVYFILPTDKGPGIRILTGLTKNTPYRFNHYPEIVYLSQYLGRYKDILTRFFEKKR